ncbi:MAG: hypothetical protein LBU37_11725 [Tannerellaceae bacterium]|jgi:hypothetical protein|nr:hypothetical protein [Tannerellaceae bacterium]
MIFVYLLCEKTNNYIYLLAIFGVLAINKKKETIMARKKMTEEEKLTKRAMKEQGFDVLAKGLKYLSYAELDELIALSARYKKEKLGKEELRLIKEKEKIELELKKLKGIDATENL